MSEKLVDELPEKLVDEVIEVAKERKLKQSDINKVLEEVKKEYERIKISPGEAIGIITAESFGEPSTQMCVLYDEKIILKSNDKIKIAKIGEFVDTIFNEFGYKKVGGYEALDISKNDLFVLSLDQNEKVKWKKVSVLNRHKSPKKLIRIKTKSGRKITATDFHSFVTRENNKVVSIAGKDLKIGDRIPVIKYLPENCIEAIATTDYVKMPTKEEIRRYHIKLIPNSIELDKIFGSFIGAYLAEGGVNGGQINISNLSNSFIKDVKEFLNFIGLTYKEDFHNRGFAFSRDLKINSSLLARFIINNCDTGSKNKKIPQFAYSAKEEFVSALLRSYFDGYGNISVSRKMIRVSSNSEELLDGIKLLLTRFGIFAFKSKDHKQDYLIIPYKYTPIFLEKIGSNIKSKRKNLEKLAYLAKKNIFSGYRDHTDMISGFDNTLVDISRKLGLRTRYVNSATKRQRIGRTALLRHISRFEKIAKEKNIGIEKELKILKRMYSSDVVWDEIEKIEYIDSKYEYVYDLSVPGLETFTTFDGIITHNTLNVFHFAGVAEMAVTVGLPRLIEIFDARLKPSTPFMEVYLKGKYNKNKDLAKNIAARIKETKLEEIVQEIAMDLLQGTITLKVDNVKLENIDLNLKSLSAKLSKSLKGVTVRSDNDNVVLKLSGKQNVLQDIYKIKEKIKGISVSGVKGVSQVLPVKENDEFMIICAGTNLKEVMKMEEVDETRTISNNLYEIRDLLGAEAARNVIINESMKVIEQQGLDIDIRHIMFVADMMTNTGSIQGVTRSGITGGKESVLARASFETPIKHIVNASLTGEVDKLNSVIENVMLNQAVPLGTGLPGLLAKMKSKEEKK